MKLTSRETGAKEVFWMKRIFLMIITLLLLTNTAFAVRLDGSNVKELVKQVRFDLSDVNYKIYDEILGISAQDIYITNAKFYKVREKDLRDDLLYYKEFDGTKVVLGVTGVKIECSNLSDEVIVIDWAESLFELGNYSGIPFLADMKYIDAGKPEKTPKTIIAPHSTKTIALFHGAPYFRSKWYDGYAPISTYGDLKALVALKVMINDKTKYYTYTTPRMYIPEYVYKPYVKIKNK